MNASVLLLSNPNVASTYRYECVCVLHVWSYGRDLLQKGAGDSQFHPLEDISRYTTDSHKNIILKSDKC